MHPEVESHIRSHAENFVENMRHDTMLSYALNSKIVSKEDIYFLGVVNGAGSVSLNDLVETGHAPVQDGIVIQDDPEFRQQESTRQYLITAALYNCTPEEAEERWDTIMTKVSEHWNKHSR